MENNINDLKKNIENSRKELSDSIEVVKRNLKLHSINKINYRKAVIKNFKTNVVNAFKKFQSSIKIDTVKKEKTSERRLNFKKGISQKVSKLKSKIGSAKNSFLSKLSKDNINLKLRQFADSVSLMGINALNKSLGVVNDVKDNIADFTSTQIANYYLRKEKINEERLENQRILNNLDAERISELEIKERTKDHKAGMKQAFREVKREERKERFLNFKKGVNQKTSSLKSKVGNIKNEILSKLSKENIDLKLRQFAEKISLVGIGALNKGLGVVNGVKDNIADFTSTQIANYYLRKEKREEERQENQRISNNLDAERISELEIKERTKDHKAGMKEAFKEVEREEYNKKHEENMMEKAKLLEELKIQREKLKKFYAEPEIVTEKPKAR